jgi:predicted transcriptional regulator
MAQTTERAEDRAADLFFQLSSTDRKRILSVLQKENIHLNGLAKRLDMTATETFRQLQRMTEAGLLEKLPDGKYRLTPYAKFVIELASPLEFVSRFREHFQHHDASLIPYEFRARLGELSGGVVVVNTVEMYNKIAEMVNEAEKRIYVTVEGFESLLNVTRERFQQGLKVKWLMYERYRARAKSFLRSDTQFPEMRLSASIPIDITLTDKAAAIALTSNKDISYSVFFGADSNFLRWTEDMFAYEWEKAKPWYP